MTTNYKNYLSPQRGDRVSVIKHQDFDNIHQGRTGRIICEAANYPDSFRVSMYGIARDEWFSFKELYKIELI